MAVESRKHFRRAAGRAIALGLSGLAVFLCLLLFVFSVPALRLGAVRLALGLAGAAPPHDEKGITNVLLLGVGDEQHDGADLTDTMMIASVDPSTRSAVLLSIPRDLYLTGNKDIPDGRINTLYVYEKNLFRARNKQWSDAEVSAAALQAVGEEMSGKLGIPVHGVIKIDFTAFTEIVDALRGVDIDVQKTVVDYQYPLEEKVNGLFRLEAGPQHLDGETALKFARTRHSGTDFDRSARQQQLIQALSAKVQGMGRLRQIRFVRSMLETLSNHMQTTLSTAEILGLVQLGTELSLPNIVMMQINYNTGGDYADAKAGGFVYAADPALYEGASVLVPTVLPADPTGWKQIAAFVSFLVNNRVLYLSGDRLQVVNVSANSLAAYRLQNELRRYGFIVDPAPKTPKSSGNQPVAVALSGSFITFTQGTSPQTAGFFSGLLGMKVSQQQTLTGTGRVVRIVLGKDYRYAPFQVLMSGE